jgi:DNA primase large subunit
MGLFGAMARQGRKAKKLMKPASDGQRQVEPAVREQRAYAKGQVKAAGAAALTAAVVGKMSLEEMRSRLKSETDEKNRALLREAITRAVAEAKDYVETKPTSTPRPKARPKQMNKGGYANCGASVAGTQNSGKK